ncbi:MAG TPA: 16S rRNA (guanine(966)-N(2))-methyltransferase RsmD [Alphaproteobacteria bacterium]|nr:16S rRNA (guanine(966)-N(2))-methyltransferase RsmD [Alphaproteobacteria bacterium]
MLRIIAGRLKGRRLKIPPADGVRPTIERVREAVFNTLTHGLVAEGGAALTGLQVADVFAGTGAMAFEALSRGAEHVIFLDTDAASLKAIDRNADGMGESDRITVRYGDATAPGVAPWPCNLVFLDAPYRSGLTGAALVALAEAGWLAHAAVCVVEIGGTEDLDPPAGFAVLDTRRYRTAKVIYLRFSG